VSRFKAIALAGGVALLAWLVYQSGARLLVEYLERVGWWIFLLLGIAAVRHSFRAGAVRRAMGEERERFSFPAMYGLVLVSEAIKFVTFAGVIFGESSKALLLRRRVSTARAVSSVVLDNLLYWLSAAFFSLAGITLIFAVYPASAAVRRAGTAGALVLLAGIVLGTVAFTRRWIRAERILGPLAKLQLIRSLGSEEWIAQRPDQAYRDGPIPPSRDRLSSSRAGRFAEIDDQVFEFHRRHRGAFYAILALDLAAHLTAACEVVVIMRLLGLPAHYLDGVATEALTKLVELGGMIVPGDVGIYQGGSGLILASLGYTMAAGVALGIVRQVRSILWAGLGFGALLFWRDRGGSQAR
jgi:glycosyltransferase 2 family protein